VYGTDERGTTESEGRREEGRGPVRAGVETGTALTTGIAEMGTKAPREEGM
jgi:hypothetical protein